MIFLSQGGPSRELLNQSGSFCWWYLDLIGESGEGLVCIWAGSLPLIPGDHAGISPIEAPSFNLAMYKNGKTDLYLLQRYPATEAAWVDGQMTMGMNRFGKEKEMVWIEVDCPIPGSNDRLTGRIQVEGTTIRLGEGPRGTAGEHRWGPVLAPAVGTAELRTNSRRWDLKGSAYHDQNWCSRPLDRLGIDQWHWGRVSIGKQQRIWYLLWPEKEEEQVFLDVQIDETSTLNSRPAQFRGMGAQMDLWGMPWWKTLVLEDPRLEIRFVHKVDAGPYYLRFLVEAQDADGQVGTGFAEVVCPSRVNRPWVAALARTRVHTINGTNSPMAGFFNGPATGRFSRFLALQRGQ